MGVLAVGAACVALWALTARLLARWNISSAIAMVVLGFLVANQPLDIIDPTPTSETVQLIAELALALLLFSDASRVTLRGLREDRRLPTRLLFVGLPLTIALGFAAAAILTDLDPWLCALVAATLAPTDAALGAPVVADERVPERIRRTLNVESGLNDGLVTPGRHLLRRRRGGGGGPGRERSRRAARWSTSRSGCWSASASASVGGGSSGVVRARGWTSPNATAVVVPSLALVCYASALHLGGNGFVAAFVGGLAFGSTQRDAAEIGELGEQLGDLLGMVVWLIFGTLLVDLLGDLTWGALAFALLALTVLRMVPGGDRAARLRAQSGQRGLHRLVRAPRARLHRVRRDRPGRAPLRFGRRGDLDRGPHGAAERPPPRRHRQPARPPLRRPRRGARRAASPSTRPPPGLPPIPQRRGDHRQP